MICAESQTGCEAIEKADKLRPDIAVLDIGMSDSNGLTPGAETSQKATRSLQQNAEVKTHLAPTNNQTGDVIMLRGGPNEFVKDLHDIR